MSMSTERAKDPNPVTPHLHKSRRVTLMICLAGLVVVLVSASLLWAFQVRNHRSGVIARGTPSLANTDPPTWTPTPIIPPAGSLFYDTFASNSHGWSVSGETGYYRILVDDRLILANAHPDTFLVETVPTANTNLKDYVISVGFTINQGDGDDSTGLYLRGDSVLDHDYRVDINGNNTVDIAKEWLDAQQTPQTTLLTPPQVSNFLRPPGYPNLLTVIMLGTTLTVSINRIVLVAVTDSSYASGQIALFAHHGPTSNGLVVSFSKVEIDQITSPLATPIVPPADS